MLSKRTVSWGPKSQVNICVAFRESGWNMCCKIVYFSVSFLLFLGANEHTRREETVKWNFREKERHHFFLHEYISFFFLLSSLFTATDTTSGKTYKNGYNNVVPLNTLHDHETTKIYIYVYVYQIERVERNSMIVDK